MVSSCSPGIHGFPGFGTRAHPSPAWPPSISPCAPLWLHQTTSSSLIPSFLHFQVWSSQKPCLRSVEHLLLHHLCLLKCFPSSDTRSTHPQDVFSLLPSYQHCPNLPLSACSAFYCSRLQACVPHSSVNTSRAELCLIQLFISHLPSNVC